MSYTKFTYEQSRIRARVRRHVRRWFTRRGPLDSALPFAVEQSGAVRGAVHGGRWLLTAVDRGRPTALVPRVRRQRSRCRRCRRACSPARSAPRSVSNASIPTPSFARPSRTPGSTLPQYGLIEMRAKAIDDPRNMVALWMIGYEDEPHAFRGDLRVRDLRTRCRPGSSRDRHGRPPVRRPGDRRRVLHRDGRRSTFASSTSTRPSGRRSACVFTIEGEVIKTVEQSPAYPMQLMLGIYEFPAETASEPNGGVYPKEFTVDYVRGYQLGR